MEQLASSLQGLPAPQAPLLSADGLQGLLPLLASFGASPSPVPPPDGDSSRPSGIDVGAAVQHVAAELVGQDTSVDAPLMEAGIDSLGAVEFRSQLSSQLGGAKLPESLIFDHPTLREIEAHVSSLSLAVTAAQPHGEQAAMGPLHPLLSALASNAQVLVQPHAPSAALQDHRPPNACVIAQLPGGDGSYVHFRPLSAFLTELQTHVIKFPEPTAGESPIHAMVGHIAITMKDTAASSLILLGYSGGAITAMYLCDALATTAFKPDALILLEPPVHTRLTPELPYRLVATSVLSHVPDQLDIGRFQRDVTSIFPNYSAIFDHIKASEDQTLDQLGELPREISVPTLLALGVQDHHVFRGLVGDACESFYASHFMSVTVTKTNANHITLPFDEHLSTEIALFAGSILGCR